MGNTHGNEPWVKKPWVYETFLVVKQAEGKTVGHCDRLLNE
jgi:hypothetical protein